MGIDILEIDILAPTALKGWALALSVLFKQFLVIAKGID